MVAKMNKKERGVSSRTFKDGWISTLLTQVTKTIAKAIELSNKNNSHCIRVEKMHDFGGCWACKTCILHHHTLPMAWAKTQFKLRPTFRGLYSRQKRNLTKPMHMMFVRIHRRDSMPSLGHGGGVVTSMMTTRSWSGCLWSDGPNCDG